MPTVMVVDDTPFWRELISDALKQKGFTPLTAADGLAALETLAHNSVDLLILDVEIPKMEGLAVLENIRRRPKWHKLPVIMLTGDMQKDHIIRARKLGAVEYLLKSRFSPVDLLERVARHLGSSPTQATPTPQAPTPKTSTPAANSPPKPMLTREQTLRRIDSALEGRTLSGTVSEVIAMCASPTMSMANLSALIARDSLLSVKVLQAANSAGRGGRGTIISLKDAVKNLGSSAVRDLAAAIAVFSALPESEPDGFNPIHCWRHSLAVAQLCNLLAPERDRGVAYLVGLCHDLGEILFRSHFGKEYRQVLEAHKTTGAKIEELTRELLGLSHGQLVQMILRKLNLPDAIRQPIASFHEAASRVPSESMGRILQLADAYANGLLLASSEHSSIRPLTRNECKEVTDQENPRRPDSVELRQTVTAMTVTQSRLGAREEAELIKPMFAPQPAKIWLARDPGLSTFDPVSAALESIAQIKIEEALPKSTELGEYQGVVVLARNSTVAGFGAEEIAEVLAKTSLPLLWLVGRIDRPQPTNPTPTVWPVSLTQLNTFICAIPAQSAKLKAA